MKPQKTFQILGIESSCDECSVSLLRASLSSEQESSLEVLELSTYSQIQLHQPFGGVVPEIASRNHLEQISPLIQQVLKKTTKDELKAIAVTNRPGLVGALLVGVSAAKALAYALKRPLVPVHHLEGHAASLFLDKTSGTNASTDSIWHAQYPLLLAIVSGGHTQLHLVKESPLHWTPDFLSQSLVGRSIDDAAGEAFDKTGKLLGLPYPGGPHLDQIAQKGNPKAFHFPRALPQKDTYDYSFSGLKTAVAIQLAKMSEEEKKNSRADLCASVQEAIVEALWKKMKLLIEKENCRSLAIVGGVAANTRLREFIQNDCHIPVYFPQQKYCSDNAAMIAAAGAFRFLQGAATRDKEMLSLSAFANAAH